MKILIITLFIICILFSYLKNVPSWFYYLFGLLLALVAGFRDVNLFMDSDNYTSAFYGEINEKFEWTFVSIVAFSRVLSNQPFFMFFIYAMLGVLIKVYAIKDLTNLLFLTLAIYISYFYILHDMTQIRAGVASGLFLIGIKYIESRNIIKYGIICLLAISFHYSAILIVPLYFIIKPKSLNKWLWFSFIPLSYFLHLAGFTLSTFIPLVPIPIIQNLWKIYELKMAADSDLTINIFNIVQLMRCCIACFMLYYSSILETQNKYFNILIKIYILGIISFVLFADIPDIAFRVSQFLLIAEIILVPLVIYIFKPKTIAYVFPAFIGLILLYLNIFYAKLVL